MSLVEDLLVILTSYSGGYKLMRQKLLMPTYPWPSYYKKCILTQSQKIKEVKEKVLKTTLSRLKKCGLVENKNKIWKITEIGKNYLKEKISSKIPHFGHSKVKNTKNNMIVIFDIPEIRKKQRNWLRGDLMALGFTQLQKSVWFGPAPLPKEFIKYLNDTNLLHYLKFFKATKEEIIDSN